MLQRDIKRQRAVRILLHVGVDCGPLEPVAVVESAGSCAPQRVSRTSGGAVDRRAGFPLRQLEPVRRSRFAVGRGPASGAGTFVLAASGEFLDELYQVGFGLHKGFKADVDFRVESEPANQFFPELELRRRGPDR